MTWPTFLAPWWGLLGLLAIPIIALYLLRQKRPDMPTSSTLLWSKALSDMRASTPFQKLRRHLLLLIQLLILAALVFARMRPVIQAHADRSLAGVIVIDATASMQATDDGGPSRLDQAKAQANTLVDDMRMGDRYMILADGGGMTQVRSAFSSNKMELHKIINSIAASDTTSDLSETLLLATTSLRALGGDANHNQAVTAGKIYLFSDGAGIRFPEIADFYPLLNYVKLGSDTCSNVGIVRLAITPLPKAPKTYQIFVGLFNAGKADRTVPVALAYNSPDKLLPDLRRVIVPARGQASAIFEVTLDPGRIYVQIGDAHDDLKLDNTAFGILEPPRKLRAVLVTKGNAILERVLQIARRSFQIEPFIVSPDQYHNDLSADIMLFDGIVPPELPKCDCLFIAPPYAPPGFHTVAPSYVTNPPILRWKKESPILSYVELADVKIGRALKLAPDTESEELISSVDTALLVARDVGSARRYVLGFNPLTESNWWSQPSLLIFLQNMLEQTRERHFIGKPQIIEAGQPAHLWDLDAHATLTTPEGSKVPLDDMIKDGAAEYPATDHVGFYDVQSGQKHLSFAVNLLSQTETDIVPQALKLPGGGNVMEAQNVAQVNHEIWTWIALTALAVLLIEWMVYHRRVA
jgi:hypothetical protein